MAEELQQLRDAVAQLRAENERLQNQPAADNRSGEPSQSATANSSSSRQTSERFVFIPRDKKCPIFRGYLGIGIDDWVEEAKACMRVRHLSTVDQAFFLFDHLEGDAKEEIKYRPKAEKEDPEKIIAILQELYGCPQSYVALQEAFFSRKQQEEETLLEFSIALMALMEKVKRRAPQGLFNADVLLRDQFVEHVRDGGLRRELKQAIRLKPTATLIDLRKQAIQWEQEGMPAAPRARSFSLPLGGDRLAGLTGASCSVASDVRGGTLANADLQEIKDMLKQQQQQISQQQQQINQLTRNMAAVQVPPQRNRSPRDGPIICRRCQGVGHIARDCDGERVAAPPRANSGNTPLASGNSQPQGN